MNKITVKKSDGTFEEFSPKKLRRSLERAGAQSSVIDEIIQKVEKTFEGKTTPTSRIYKVAFGELAKFDKPQTAARYSLKRAVLDLGPSGFPFEYFLTEIYSTLGFETETGAVLKGGCATHEVDVVAVNEKEVRAIEAKFHNSLGFKTDLRVMLYVSARMDDLLKSGIDGRLKKNKKGIGMLITNTSFTSNSIAFADCVGLEVISWNHPEDRNLHELIQETGLHPLTCLTTLSNEEKKKLLEKGVVLCSMIEKDDKHLREIGIKKGKMEAVKKEIKDLCTPEAQKH